MVLKLDTSKVYDHMEWLFLKKIMEKLGFAPWWVTLIMKCVTSVSYSVLWKGQSSTIFKPQRGLRQGDPLSPFLFLLSTKGFSSILKQAETHGAICGVSVAQNAPFITRLLFAEDSLLFAHAIPAQCLALKEIFTLYERPSSKKKKLGEISYYLWS